jgi:hypothetical protein
MNFESDVKIDESCLDIEWLQQPLKMIRYCKYLADCRKELDLKKEKLDVIKAQLDSSIRKRPEYYNIDKLTESAIQNTILLQDEYKEASDEYLEAKYNYDIAQAVVKAMEQRRDALENLVKLFGLQYFAGPKEPRNLTQELNNKIDKVDKIIAQRAKGGNK